MQNETIAQSAAVQLLSLILPIILTALLAGLGVLFREWREERNRNHRFNEIIKHAKRGLVFWKEWSTITYPLLNANEQKQAQEKLRDVLSRIRQNVEDASGASAPRRDHNYSRWWRGLFLVGCSQTWWLKILRILYLIILSFSLLIILIGTIGSDRNQNLALDVILNTLVSITILLPTIIIWLITRNLSIAVRRRSQS